VIKENEIINCPDWEMPFLPLITILTYSFQLFHIRHALQLLLPELVPIHHPEIAKGLWALDFYTNV
jgi:hypothetical protein